VNNVNLFDLFVRIGADTSEAEAGVSGLAGKLKSGLASVAKVSGAVVTAAVTGVTALTKAAVDGYTEYEQLVGGVETLFGTGGASLEEYAQSVGKSVDEVKGEYGSLMTAQDTVLDNAANAFKTAGMSANEYMETVTGFSAALIKSMNGDTEAAAQTADRAITDMADNANKMGSSLESIQNAYQGFAKQNYTMLDNLKLGYGGTKEEMQRLLEDAERLSGVKYDISSYADIVNAIHVIQGEMGISGRTAEEVAEIYKNTGRVVSEQLGTTAKEASTTIQGSISTMKSAWDNLAVGLADPSQDLGVLINNLVDSVVTVGENIIPRIGETIPRILDGITSLASTIPPYLEQMIGDVFPILVNSVTTLIEDLVKVIPSVLNTAMKQLPNLAKSAAAIVIQLAQGISENSGELMGTLAEVATSIIEILTGPDVLSNLLTAALDLITNLAVGIVEMIPTIIAVIPTIITNVLTAVVENIPILLEMVPTIINSVVDALVESIPLIVDTGVTLLTALVEALPDIIENIVAVIPEIISSIVGAVIELVPELVSAGVQLLTAIINNLPEIITTIIAAIPEIITAVVTALTEAVPTLIQMGIGLFTSIVNDLPTIIEGVISALPEIITGIVNALMENLPIIAAAGVDLFVSIIMGIPEAIVAIVKAIPEIITAIKDAFLSVDWADIGRQLINGIGEGFKNGVENIKEKFKEGGEKLKEGFKDFFGIHSPSKVFAEYGEYLAEGLGEGWESTIPDVNKSINNSMDFSATAPAASADGSLGNITININGIQYQNFDELVAAISEQLQFLTDRRVMGYGD
jgi:phage-related protein